MEESPPELPPVHEQAAMIEYLDTYELTRQVKCVLHENNLGQRAFGEAVLGLTQGSVSDLLSKPKMWLKLSMKGREPYVRMYLWLQDKNSIEKVRNYKPRRKPKRVMTLTPHGMSTPIRIIPPKRPRMILSPEEKQALHAAYNADAYPAPASIDRIAKELNLPESTVINWFHNHRSRLKRQPIYPISGQSETSPVYIMSGSGEDQPQVITIQNEGPSTSTAEVQALSNGDHDGEGQDTDNSKALDALREAVDLATRGANAELATSEEDMDHIPSSAELDEEGKKDHEVDDLGEASPLSSQGLDNPKDKSSPVLGGNDGENSVTGICCSDDGEDEGLSQNPYEVMIKL